MFPARNGEAARNYKLLLYIRDTGHQLPSESKRCVCAAPPLRLCNFSKSSAAPGLAILTQFYTASDGYNYARGTE
jgi:hypothetical protein